VTIAIAPIIAAAFSGRRLRTLASLAVVVALASAALTAALMVGADAARRVDRAFADADAAELILYVDPGAADEVIAELEVAPGIGRVADPVPVADGMIVVGDDRVEAELRPMTSAPFNAPTITDGRAPAAPGEVLLDTGLAAAAGSVVGGTVDLVVDGRRQRLQVVGLGFDFSDCFYPTCDPVRAWVDTGWWPTLQGAADETLLVAAEVDRPGTEPVVVERVRSRVGERLLGENHWTDTRADLLTEAEFLGVFLGVFGLFMLVTSAVVISGEISARAAARRRTIGLYKSVGFTTRQLTTATVVEHLTVAAAASTVGAVVAQSMAGTLRIGSLRILESGPRAWNVSQIIASVAIVSAVVLVSSLIPAWRAGRLDVVSALDDVRPGRAGRRRRGPQLARRAPLALTMAWTTARSRWARTLTCAGAIGIAIVVTACSLAIHRSVDAVVLDPAFAGAPEDVTIEPPDELSPEEVEARLRTIENSTWFSRVDDTATIDGIDVTLRAVGGPASGTAFEIGAGRAAMAPGEALAGYGLIRDLGWEIGDRVDVEVAGAALSLELVGWYRETEDLGRVLQVRMDDYRLLRPDVRPDYGVIDPGGPAAGVLALERLFGTDAEIEPNRPDTSGVAPFRTALLAMTLMIAAVAFTHLVSSVATTGRERRHRFATQRAVGFEDRQLRVEAVWHGIVTAGVAVVVALPLAWLAQRTIVDTLTAEVGVGPGLGLGPSPVAWALIGGGALLVSGVAALAATLPGLAAGRRRPDVGDT
jgi:putative ABC transport system permease protein